MLALGDCCDLFHQCYREWNTLAEELTHWAREARDHPAYLVKDDRRRSDFSSTVESTVLVKTNKNTYFLLELDGLCRRRTKLATPKWETWLQVCCAMAQGTTVTQAETRAATKAAKVVVSMGSCWRIRSSLQENWIS